MKISPVLITSFRNCGNKYFSRTYCQKNPYTKKQFDNLNFGYNFALKTPNGIPCAYCGRVTFAKSDAWRLMSLKGRNLVNELESFASQNKNAFNQQSLEALSLFEKIVLDNPDKSGKEILPIAYIRSRNRMLVKQSDVYSQVGNLAQALESSELMNYINSVKAQDIVLNPNISTNELYDFLQNKLHIQFRKEVLLRVMQIAAKEANNESVDTWFKIMTAINKLPSSKNDADAYLVKYISKAIRKDPKMGNKYISVKDDAAVLFYYQLLYPFVSSAEHVVPHSVKGESNFTNYLVTHTWCNNKRMATDFCCYVKKNPQILNNILTNLNFIKNTKGSSVRLSRFDTDKYLQEIKQRLHALLVNSSDVPEISGFLDKLSRL